MSAATSANRSEDAYCIVGAGPSGLAVLKNFVALGIACEAVEREDDVGGNWYYGRPSSSVYQSTYLVSSKRLTEYPDYPMPEEWPEYPSHAQALAYLRSYARQFDLYRHIRLNTAVERIEPNGSGWEVTLSDGRRQRYRGVVIANGHHWDPQWPDYPGTFDGLTIHSSQYKTPDVLIGKRVLVVGGGNSGCDIAVEAAQHAAATWHSTRRGYHYLPKFLYGKPVDRCGERLLQWGLPLWLRRLLTARAVKLALGRPEDYGLPAADHRFWETHPIVNSQLLYHVGHGRIIPKPDLAELAGTQVRFVDGSTEAVDVIVHATGFKLSFPFIDREHLNWRDGRPELFLNIFHPQRDDLFVAGMIQPDSGQWGLVHAQAQLIGRFIKATREAPSRAERFRRLKAGGNPDLGGGIRYVRSPRHRLEVEHYSYRRRLRKLIAQLAV